MQLCVRRYRDARELRDLMFVAALIVWIATAPSTLVLNEAVISPLDEEDWP